MDRISPRFTGLRPLPGPLPKKQTDYPYRRAEDDDDEELKNCPGDILHLADYVVIRLRLRRNREEFSSSMYLNHQVADRKELR